MDAAATEGRHLTCRPRKKASAQLRRWSSRTPAGPSLRSGGGVACQPCRALPASRGPACPHPRPRVSCQYREANTDPPSWSGMPGTGGT